MDLKLLIIDPQYDFCNPNGTLYVTGAETDMLNLSTLIARLDKKIDGIFVTLDSHHDFDIAHPDYWIDGDGKHPAPFTLISEDDVVNGKWVTKVPSLMHNGADGTLGALDYVKTLAVGGRYPLCIWPPHCLIGSVGQTIVDPVYFALQGWVKSNPGTVDYITKGSNVFTEHYSGVKAEVPDPADASTQINTRIIKTLEEADIIAIAGEASSHCVANTIRDIMAEFGDPALVQKMVLLEDCMSPVPGFESFAASFFDDFKNAGGKIVKSTDFLV